MYYQVEQVLEQQEPEIEKFYKGRGLLICEAKQGLFALKEYFGSAQKAEFLYWLGICLEQQGILCDSMLKNKDGNLITEGPDRIPYTFHRWVRGRECEVKNRTELLETVSFLADFHRCCSESGVEQTEEESAEEEMTKLGEEYVRHNRELKHIRKYILKRNNKSKFERLYLECYEAAVCGGGGISAAISGTGWRIYHWCLPRRCESAQYPVHFRRTGPDPDGTCPCGSTDYGRG